MIIYMLETTRGSENGFEVRRFHEGKRYNVGDTLGCSFLRKGVALKLEDEDFEICVKCKEPVLYADENGICNNCDCLNLEKSSAAAYAHMVTTIGNYKCAKALGWI